MLFSRTRRRAAPAGGHLLRVERLEPRRLLAAVPVRLGTEFPVNTTTALEQSRPAVADDGAGQFVVAWQSMNQDGDGWGIYARRFGAPSAAPGDEFRVNTYTQSHQTRPSVAASAAGFVVVWQSDGQDGSGAGIFGQAYDAAGAPRGGEFAVNNITEALQATPVVAMAADGRFVVAWADNQADADGWDIFARRFAANGTPDGDQFPVHIDVAFNQTAPSVAMAPDGKFVIAWDGQLPADASRAVFARRFDANGSPADIEFPITPDGVPDVLEPSVAMGADGSFVVAWHTPGADADGSAVQARRYGGDGIARGDAFLVNAHTTGDQTAAAVSAGTDGFVVTWQSVGQDGDLLGVYARRYDADGVAAGSDLAANTHTAGDQFAPAVTLGPDGRFVVVWQSAGQDGSLDGVYAQRFAPEEPPLDPPAISVSGGPVTEPDSGATTDAIFTVTLSAPRTYPVSVRYATQDASAVAPADYTAAAGTLTFAPGETSKTVAVTVAGDALDEADETFSLVLSEPVNGTIQTTSAAAQIVDNDPLPFLNIADTSVVEGSNGGNAVAVFPLTLSAPSGREIRVAYRLSLIPGDTATRGFDWTGDSGILVFAPGETSKSLAFPVIDDTLDEADETFNVVLGFSGAITFAFPDDGAAVATIVDDDPLPTLTVGEVSVAEGDDAAGRVVDVPVQLSAPSGRTVTVNYNTVDDTATAGADYTFTSGTFSFAPGETTKTIQVHVFGDTVDEPDERFWINLWNPQNAEAFDRRVTILDDDDAPVVNISLLNPGTTLGESFDDGMSLLVTLSRPSNRTVTVDVATVNDTAIAGQDYHALRTTVTFLPGETTKDVTVIPIADRLDEADERLFVDLTAATNATIGRARETVVVVDDDPLPGVRFETGEDIVVDEGHEGITQVPVTLLLVRSNEDHSPWPSGRAVTVGLVPSGSAIRGVDYLLPDSVTFAPGETSKTFNVTIIGDRLREQGGEEIVIGLQPDFASVTEVARTQEIGIRDDDPDRYIAIDNSDRNTFAEGDGADVREALFPLVLSSPADAPVTVRYVVRSDTATAGADFAAIDATVTFAPGETEKTVRIPLVNDDVAEVDEMFWLDTEVVSGPASSNEGSGWAIITDDDWNGVPPPTVTGVYVAGTTWSPAFRQQLAQSGAGSEAFGYFVPDGAAQLDELPWTNVDQISIRFDIGVSVRQEDLSVISRNTSLPQAVSAFTYDADSHTATWTLARPLGNDNFELGLEGGDGVTGAFNGLPLNGYWQNGEDTYPSGHNSPPSSFAFWLNVLPGDVTRSGTVDAADVLQVRSRQSVGTTSPTYSILHDVNGSGRIDVLDQALVRARQQSTLVLPAARVAVSAASVRPARVAPVRRDLFGATPILA